MCRPTASLLLGGLLHTCHMAKTPIDETLLLEQEIQVWNIKGVVLIL